MIGPAKPKIIKNDSLGILILRSKIDCKKDIVCIVVYLKFY